MNSNTKHLLEDALYLAKALEKQTLSMVSDGVIRLSAGGMVEYLNPVAEKLTGWDLGQAEQKSLSAILEMTPLFSDSEVIIEEEIIALSNIAGMKLYKRASIQNKQGEIFYIECDARPVYDDSGALFGLVITLSDVTQASELLKELAYQASHDHLTGLPNRSLFIDRLQQAMLLRERNDDFFATIILSLDDFKKINDSMGYEFGDEVLQSIAKRFKSTLRKSDTIARLSGDEFGIILSHLPNINAIVRLVEKLYDLLGRPVTHDKSKLSCKYSMGISVYPNDGNAAEDLLHNADTAVNAAKRDSLIKYQFYSTEINEANKTQNQLARDLKAALANDEFIIYYQPQIDLSTDKPAGVEALLRWRHPRRGLIMPNVFIPIAEETGQIIQVGEWVIKNAVEQMQLWQDQGLPKLRMAVNLSVYQLENISIIDCIAALSKEQKLSTVDLELELTESALMDKPDEAAIIIKKFKEYGVTIAIDDFGVGYSSLAYLKRFTVDCLKIDRTFINDVTVDKDGAELVKTIILMCQNLHLSVIAEGVETIEQMEFLRANKCQIVQGYLYSRPQPPEECFQYLMKTFSS